MLAAAQAGNAPAVQQALLQGERHDTRDPQGYSALHLAAKGGHANCIQLLLSAQADVNLRHEKTDATALVFAAMSGHAAACQLLLQAGARVDITTRKGKTALGLAQEKGHAEVVALLQGGGGGGGAGGGGGGAPAAGFFGSPPAASPFFGAPPAASPCAFAPAAPPAASPCAFAPAPPPAASPCAFAPAAPPAASPCAFAPAAPPAASPCAFAPAAPPAASPCAFAPAAPPAASPCAFGPAAPAAASPCAFAPAPPPAASPCAFAPAAPPAASPCAFAPAAPPAASPCAFAPAAPPAASPCAFGPAAPAAASPCGFAPTVPSAAPPPVFSPPAAAAAPGPTFPTPPRTSASARALPSPPADSVSDLSFCGGADLLAAASWDGTVRLWDVQPAAASPALIATYCHTEPVLCTAWEPTGRCVYSGGGDHAVRSFDHMADTLSLLGEHSAPVSCMRTCQEHPSVVFTGGWDKNFICWDNRAASKVSTISMVERVYSLDVRWPIAALSTASAGSVFLIDMRKQSSPPQACPVHAQIARYPPRSIALFPPKLFDEGAGVCVGSYEGRVAVHFLSADGVPKTSPTASSGLPVKWGETFQFKCHRSKAPPKAGTSQPVETLYAVTSMAFHPTRFGALATAGSDGEVMLWDIVKRMKLSQLVQPAAAAAGGPPVGVPAIAFSRTGDLLAFARSDDWSGGEEQYTRLGSAGHSDDVMVLAVPPEQ